MIVKYCPVCYGRPYTQDMSMSVCPKCNSALQSEFVDESSLSNRAKIRCEYTESYNFPDRQPDTRFPVETGKDDLPANSQHSSDITDAFSQLNGGRNNDRRKDNNGLSSLNSVVSGKVFQYSSSGKEDGNYRRLFITKLIDAAIYHQRMEDVLHRFTIRTDNGMDVMGNNGYADIPVNVHGTIASGIQLTDGCEVEISGKYRNGVLMANKIDIVNNGYKSRVKFQRSVSTILYGILAMIAVAVIIWFTATANSDFVSTIKSFFITWGITAVIFTVLHIILSLSKVGLLIRLSSGKKKRFPIVGILLISLIITILLLSFLGI